MRIAKLKIENYKCFLSSGEIRLTEGFNVIVGQNNTGKTALAEALSLRFGDIPHRSLKTLPDRGPLTSPTSRVDISFELGGDELMGLLNNTLRDFYVPVPPSLNAEAADRAFRDAISGRTTFECSFQQNRFTLAYLSKYGNVSGSQALRYQSRPPDAPLRMIGAFSGTYEPFTLPLAGILRDRIYLFKAERFNVAESNMGVSPILSPDASNLPEVLHLLQGGNPARFNRLKEYVSIVFPEVREITVPPLSNNRARILVWSIDSKTERDDLAMPLAESGTGFGQVLAMLYVVITSDYPRTIIIDEPQSFLHPGAIRKLIDILKQHPKHQYVITTHSPTVVTAADPQTLLLLRKKEAESVIEPINVAETQQLRLFLSEIGARLSDVFGADNILWVEGRTEEQCFPLILSKIEKQRLLLGTAIVGVTQTGDLEGRHARTVLEIYERLCKGQGLLPPAIGFIFDREGRSETEQENLKRASKGTVHFLPRRMYENYLLNPRAIASVMSSIDEFREKQITEAEVEDWLKRNQWNREYLGRTVREEEQTADMWVKNVHGANVLKDMFKEFSENRINFDKIQHGVLLINWIVENAPQDLAELAQLIKDVLMQGDKPVPAPSD